MFSGKPGKSYSFYSIAHDNTGNTEDAPVSAYTTTQVKAGVEDCNNGIDDDGDGLVDCKDPDCASNLDCACKVTSITLIPGKAALQTKKSIDIIVAVRGEEECLVNGQMVRAIVGKANRKFVFVKPRKQMTDKNGLATFQIKAKGEAGKARIKFKSGKAKKVLTVKIKAEQGQNYPEDTQDAEEMPEDEKL